MVKVLSWNIARRDEAWRFLLETGADIALLQEASPPPADVAREIEVGPASWHTASARRRRPWRSAVVKLSDRCDVQWLPTEPLTEASASDFAVSTVGSLAVAKITPAERVPFIVVSMYAPWERPHRTTGSNWIYADASAHRIISDLSALIGRQRDHRVLAAGDLNILHGYGEGGSPYWGARYATIFARMDVLGLSFIGPQAPAGRQAHPWPDELPPGSDDVPTFYHSRQTAESATRQLDFVFASDSMAEEIHVHALNQPSEWGPSDHCRVSIQIG